MREGLQKIVTRSMLKISQKVNLALVTLAATTGIGALVLTVPLQRVSHELGEFHQPALSAVQTLKSGVAEGVKESFAYLVSGEKAERHEFEAWATTFPAQVGKVRALAKMDEPGEEAERALLEQIVAEQKTLIAAAHATFADYEHRRSVSPRNFRAYEESVDALLTDVNNLLRIEQAEVFAAQEVAKTMFPTVTNRLYLLAALSVLAALVMGVFLSRSITRPLVELTSLAKQLGESRSDESEGSWHRDELSALASALKSAQEDLGRRAALEAQFQQTQKLESLGVLAGGIAHDFNNLLVGILGNAELALTQLPEASPARENLKDVEQAALRAAEVTKQLLAYSGRSSIEKKQFNLSVLIEEMSQLLRVSVSKNAVLKSEFARGLPAIAGDPSQIRQVVMNLIINASDALGDKPGEITVKTGRSRTGRDRDGEMTGGDYIYLEISDTGCGMDAETQEKIFDPFFTTHGLGRGLGLAALQGIVRSHHGFVELESERGRGTTFRIFFPALSRPVETAKEERPSFDQWRGDGTILVVDDNAAMCRLAESVLTRCGLEVLIARDGVEGVEVFREHSESISVVLLDLTMPRMGGEQALEEMLRIRPSARVILTSGFDQKDIAARFSDKLLSFLHKPFRMEELVEKVREVLEW